MNSSTSNTASPTDYEARGYDAGSNVTSLRTRSGDTIALAISEMGSALLTFGYDAMGRRSSIGRANGVTTSYGYDPVSRLASLAANLGGAGGYSAAFAYTPSSQLHARTQSNDAAYAWKTSANQSIAYAANGLNQIAGIQGINLTYDANGNLTRGAGQYAYDIENKLRSASSPTPVTLGYDPLGRLYQTSSPAGTAQLLYDGDDVIGEYDGTGNFVRRYIHGPGIDEPLVQYDSIRRFLHADERGSIVAASDNSGATLATQGYSPTGQPDSWSMNRFGYTGQIAIPEAMLWHYKARAYAPRLGRFLQTDPIGTEGGLNLYAYASGDPVNLLDPMGLASDIKESPQIIVSCDTTCQLRAFLRWERALEIAEKLTRDPREGMPKGGAEGGGGGSGGKQDKTEKPKEKDKPAKPAKTRAQCATAALGENYQGLGLDALGVAATLFLPEGSAATAIAGSVIGLLGIASATQDRDIPAGALAYTGKQAAASEGLLGGAGSALAHRIGVGALAASSAYDVAKTTAAYNNCLAGE